MANHIDSPASAPMTKSSTSKSAKSSSSLFAEDYSLSSPSTSSPSSPSMGTPGASGASVLPAPLSLSASRDFGKKIDVPLTITKQPLISPGGEALLTPSMSPRRQDYFHQLSSARPASPSSSYPYPNPKNKVSFSVVDPLDMPAPKPRGDDAGSSSRKSKGYNTYESCMEGAMGHDAKSASYKVGTEKAYHHLNRTNELFQLALSLRPKDKKAMLGRSKTLIQLATNYQPPRVATASLRESTHILRQLVVLAPTSMTARETLSQSCSLLSSTLHETEDYIEDEVKVWNGEIGELAREALQNLEDVAADKMDRMREMDGGEAAGQSPEMAEMFLSLAEAALVVSSLAQDLTTVDLHIELAEQALDQASNMATVAATSRVKSSTSSANLIARVQHVSGKSSLERLRHTFTLGVELDEDDFRALISDLSLLATECRERAAKLKGHKAAAAATLAWETIKQLGDAKTLYANLLRLVWRQRKPRRRSGAKAASSPAQLGAGTPGRRTSARQDSADHTIHEEEEDGDGFKQAPSPARRDSVPRLGGGLGRRESASSTGSDPHDSARKGSAALAAVSEDAEVSSFENRRRFTRGSISIPATGRRGSWLPSPTEVTASRNRRKSSVGVSSPLSQSFASLFTDGSNDGMGIMSRTRRISSVGGPLQLPDGSSAWSRKASVISLQSEDEALGLVPSSELAKSSWMLLEGSIKQYKLALTVINGSNLPNAQLARAKNETLTAIAYSSLFMASLAPRLSLAAEKRESLLVNAEVYTTWAAREVGWSFLIEGTQAAQLADRRTNSWRADEGGKRAVMLLLRIWWHRAVTTQSIDVDTKRAAKDAVETVVKRMKDKEGVREGDVFKARHWLFIMEGEMDTAEGLFWRSVCRILRGGAGFVMS
ncbi:hypothetical protein IAT38_005524 [Cryptococcus sp. DSM 104549]